MPRRVFCQHNTYWRVRGCEITSNLEVAKLVLLLAFIVLHLGQGKHVEIETIGIFDHQIINLKAVVDPRLRLEADHIALFVGRGEVDVGRHAEKLPEY